MKWIRIKKEESSIPTHGSKYSDWKSEIAEEGKHQCVYCCIKEKSFGGIRNFHIEHFKPKSKFKKDEHDFMNLFYACSICNCFKGDDWPSIPIDENNIISYPNPSKVDYNNIFDVNWTDGEVQGKDIVASYMIEKIYLNRPQLILERKQVFILSEVWRIIENIQNQKEDLYSRLGNDKEKVISFLRRIDEVIKTLLELIKFEGDVIPYKISQIKRKSE